MVPIEAKAGSMVAFELIQYAVRLVSATRTPEKHDLADLRRFITYGASPRATINLTEGSRALRSEEHTSELQSPC